MLQKLDFEDDVEGLDRSHMLRPAFYWELVQRRWLYFVIPFVIIASGGLAVAKLWPAVYLSEGKILVEFAANSDGTCPAHRHKRGTRAHPGD